MRKLKRKRPMKTKHRWEGNIKMDLKELIKIHLTQDIDQLWVRVNMTMKLGLNKW
jgi:hypothetical protein